MNKFLTLFALLCLTAPCYAVTQRALLIGISQYQAALSPLPGARNDIDLMSELLIRRYGFAEENVRILVDEQATRDAILSEISSLARDAASDDIVYLHYSGHGSQVPDHNGDEDDGKDETIVPYDARTEGIPDITDDEINGLISEFRTNSLVIVLDSCHSGTGTRSGPAQVVQRWIPPDDRAELYRRIQTRGAVNLPVSENHVLFAAAQEFESELDGPFGPDRMRLGLFTAAMAAVLSEASSTVTPRELIDGVNAQVEVYKASAANMPIPEPNLEAPLEKFDRPLFVSHANGEADSLPIMSNVPQFQKIASVYVLRDGRLDRDLADSLAASAGDEVHVAQSVDAADAVVEIAGRDLYNVYGPSGSVQVARELTREKALASGVASANRESLDFLADVVRTAPTVADLVTMTNPSSQIQLRLRAAGVPGTREAPLSTRSIRVTANTGNHKLRFYVPGQARNRKNSLQLEISTTHDCYLTLFSVNSIGQVFTLLPNEAQTANEFIPDGMIAANNTVSIPDSLEEGNAAGFHFDYAPPSGLDRVVATCFTELAAAEYFRNQLKSLDRSNSIDPAMFESGSRGLTNITPGLQTVEGPVDDGQADEPVSEVSAQSSYSGIWNASILTLEVGEF